MGYSTMKIDLYTRFILTVIALCLVWIGSQHSVDYALAQETIIVNSDKPLKVVICNEKGSRCADIAFGGKIEVDID